MVGKYGLEVANPVAGNGTYLADTPLFAGQHVFKANDKVVDCCVNTVLCCIMKLICILPHCWRHKPDHLRATRSGLSAWNRPVCVKSTGGHQRCTLDPGMGQNRIEA